MEDLLEEPHSPHRYLVTSSSGAEGEEGGRPASTTNTLGSRSRFLSNSCPDVSAPSSVYLTTQQSLPDKLNTESVFLNLHRMREKQMFGGIRHHHHRHQTSRQPSSHSLLAGQCPCTPPPSPLGDREADLEVDDDALVHVKILLVEPRCPDFATRYKSTQQFVDVNFNCLDTLVSLHSWVVVLDFFDIGGGSGGDSTDPEPEVSGRGGLSVTREEASDRRTTATATSRKWPVSSSGGAAFVASEMEIQVRRLSLVLNKREYELARVSLCNLVARVSSESNGDCTVVGKLGKLAVTDLTPHGHLYRERFAMAGYEVLDFRLFRYGAKDPHHTQRSHDASVKLEMSSVHYVHTNRFFAELLTFFQQFDQLRGIVERFRAAEGQLAPRGTSGKDSRDEQPTGVAQPRTRVLLDVRVGSPVVLVPCSSWSDQVLVADLGRLRLSNAFMAAGSPGTISRVTATSPMGAAAGAECGGDGGSWPDLDTGHLRSPGQPCLLDVMYVRMHDIDLFSAVRMDRKLARERGDPDEASQLRFSTYVVRKRGGALLTDKCKFDLQLERNLSDTDHSVPDASVRGALSTVHCRIHVDQYKLIRGILQHNLGESLDDLDLSELAFSPFPTSGSLSGAAANVATTANQQSFPIHKSSTTTGGGMVWTRLSFHVDLHNVVVEFLSRDDAVDGDSSADAWPLARVNFIKSRLTYESASDQSSFVDLVSQEILISDTRYDHLPQGARRPNTFSNILQPTTRPGAEHAGSELLQAELHYRFTRSQSGLTILLNNMQVIAIFDWWQTVLRFLTVPSHQPPVVPPTESTSAQVSRSVLASRYAISVSAGIATKRGSLIDNSEPPFELKINITDTGVVVVADASAWDTDALTLKSTAVVRWRPPAAHSTSGSTTANQQQQHERPLSCTLQSLEIFSCVLGLEEDTALSIVDPVTINLDVSAHDAKSSGGLLDVNEVDLAHKLEVSVQDLRVRLSYHDVQLFIRILDSLPKQYNFFSGANHDTDPPVVAKSPGHLHQHRKLAREPRRTDASKSNWCANNIGALTALGFRPEDCRRALEANGGRLDDAALWLTQHASPTAVTAAASVDQQGRTQPQLGTVSLHLLSLHVSTICVCLIDDCRDADVPLAELTLSRLNVEQCLDSGRQGSAAFVLSGDYYDRGLSGWEPFLEPWVGSFAWETRALTGNASKLSVSVEGGDVLDLNVTSTLVQLYQSVQKSWTEDYYRGSTEEASVQVERGQQQQHNFRRRSPFVPFALRNLTGCNLRFSTVTVNPDQLVQVDHQSGVSSPGSGSRRLSSSTDGQQPWQQQQQGDGWTEAGVDETKPFTFEARLKMRHRDTHQVKMHQLIVRLDGYQPMTPVSVDKVGTFFRHARPVSSRSGGMFEPPEARIVFAVTLEGSARKLVTVRSALLLHNRLGSTLEIRLENTSLQLGAVGLFYLSPGQQMPVPLPYVGAHIFARPVDGDAHPVLFCSSAVQWQQVSRAGDCQEATYFCAPMSTRPNVRHYRFCASVLHQPYPTDAGHSSTTIGSSGSSTPPLLAKSKLNASLLMTGATSNANFVQPGHLVTFIAPVVLVNLLPCDLAYEVRPVGDVRGVVRPGQEVALHLVDLSETFEIRTKFDNFVVTNDLVVQAGTSGFSATLRAVDAQNRALYLRARVIGGRGCSIRVHVSAPYWLVNKTGLPLVFRQDGLAVEAAGQSAEHEMARSVAPLLFSFADEAEGGPALLTVRVGRSVHPTGEPQWCSSFPLRAGIRCKRLCVLSRSDRPDSIYSLGIDVRPGHGRYSHVHVVTLVPRFHLDNHSSRHLEFSQRYALHNGHLEQVRLTAKSRSLLPFHWPRPDLDQLLCVRASDVAGSRWSGWSGGFCIDRAQSFHVNMRDVNGRPFFLRAEIVLQGATYFVVLSDADQLPPPFRIDNLSDVPVSCHQTETTAESLRLSVRPHQSIPYAWDEPTLQPWLTCTAPGGSRAKYNLNSLGEGKEHLSYENFIYIAFTETFARRDAEPGVGYASRRAPDDVRCRQLVLDVLDGTRVVLSRKEPGNRSQLWRMTSAGLLQHEGSSPPRLGWAGGRGEESNGGGGGGGGSSSNSGWAPSPSGLVLDTADKAPLPTEHCPLVLRKQDPRRSLTQTWEFTEDGRLRCKFHGLFVQCADGFYGLVSGSAAVLGQSQPLIYSTTLRGIPTEQAVGRQKLWPGSGLLGVNVVADGPTRVLQILDLHQKSQTASSTAAPKSGQDVAKAATSTANANRGRTDQKTASVTLMTSPLPPPPPPSSWCEQVEVQVRLSRGVGLSLINSSREELLYVRLSGVALAYTHTPLERSVDGSVRDVQVDNQLPDSQCPVLLFVSPGAKVDLQQQMPAISFVLKHVSGHHTNVDIFKPFILEVKNLTLPIDERLLWKLAQFFGVASPAEQLASLQQAPESQRFSEVEEAALAKRFYFSLLKLSLNRVRLSMMTDSRLPADLAAIKNQMALTLIRFEDAQVELDPFVRIHPFETSRFLVDSIVRHYKEELKKQAAKILVAFDFLGNPVGLVNDFSEGLSEFKEGNVGGLLKNVTHGLSNSAAKVTGTLSDGLGVVSMDDRHEVTRKKIRTEHGGSSSDHLVAGFKGLGFGLLSGVTSIFTQTYVGASEEGLPGFFTGLGKGVVGTFTKPAAGVLDLAASAASAVRDTSRGKNHYFPSQIRKRRLCVGPGGLLPRYSADQSRGQELLYILNNKDYSEMFIHLEVLNYSNDGLRALVSSKSVYFLSQDSGSSTSALRGAIILEVHFKDLYHCKIAKQMGDIKVAYYLELTTRATNSSSTNTINETKYNRPRVLCDTEEIALKVTQQINYAKGVYEELVHTLGVSGADLPGDQ